MKILSLGAIESRFADMIWENEPISSSELSQLAEKTLGWKKTTSYTVLKRLCEKGLFQNEKGTVTALMTKQDFHSMQSKRFVEEAFDGSLPAFLAAFTRGKKLSEKEVLDLRRMIAEYEEE